MVDHRVHLAQQELMATLDFLEVLAFKDCKVLQVRLDRLDPLDSLVALATLAPRASLV